MRCVSQREAEEPQRTMAADDARGGDKKVEGENSLGGHLTLELLREDFRARPIDVEVRKHGRDPAGAVEARL